MLKHFGVRVLAVRIHGAYLVCPKFDVKDRYGKVEVELDELFSPEQLQQMPADEIERKVDEAIFTDDYDWRTRDCLTVLWFAAILRRYGEQDFPMREPTDII